MEHFKGYVEPRQLPLLWKIVKKVHFRQLKATALCFGAGLTLAYDSNAPGHSALFQGVAFQPAGLLKQQCRIDSTCSAMRNRQHMQCHSV
jgi:hypothetical protein